MIFTGVYSRVVFTCNLCEQTSIERVHVCGTTEHGPTYIAYPLLEILNDVPLADSCHFRVSVVRVDSYLTPGLSLPCKCLPSLNRWTAEKLEMLFPP